MMMIEERDDWFVKNVRDARWYQNSKYGKFGNFEGKKNFPQTGVNLWVMDPGRANCRYHRENSQEDFLVLSGECLLLVNGQEQPLKPGDFVHCEAGVSHVFVNNGDRPCMVVAIGHRPPDHELFYPHHELAAKHGAQAVKETSDPKEAYADTEWKPCDPPAWPLD
jgi:uncharacterized cupin superfamily protein